MPKRRTPKGKNEIRELVDLLRKSNNTVVLTGAGISTASGIPDFRSPVTGLWQRMDPNLLSVETLVSAPELFYQHCKRIFTPMLTVEPNPAHYALARMEDLGYIKSIITQNIDGLHQKAGAKKVLEVHGHLRTAYCVNCLQEIPLTTLLQKVDKGEIPPLCPRCQGILRPSVVLFGDLLPEDFIQAQREVATSALLLVVGSSLEVSPVNTLPSLASNLAIINLTSTGYDPMARVVLHAEAAAVLTAVAEELT
ncbi:MAG: SIR2 family NAD-dependent protein deacylase [bacterium]